MYTLLSVPDFNGNGIALSDAGSMGIPGDALGQPLRLNAAHSSKMWVSATRRPVAWLQVTGGDLEGVRL